MMYPCGRSSVGRTLPSQGRCRRFESDRPLQLVFVSDLYKVCKWAMYFKAWLVFDAGWSSLAARWAHNPKVVGSNPAPATIFRVPARHSQ